MSRRSGLLALALLGLSLTGCGRSVPPLLDPAIAIHSADKADWAGLPRLPVKQGVVFEGQANLSAFNIHNYLAHDGARFEIMWTSNPVNEGEAGSRVMRAVSDDGLTWSRPSFITPMPPPGQRYFARGFWRRADQTLALVSQDRAGGYFGADLRMLAFEQQGRADQPWTPLGTMATDVITNYSPARLSDGAWLESGRASDKRISFLKGGVAGWNRWTKYPVPQPSRRWDWRIWPATAPERRPPGERWRSWVRLPVPVLVRPSLDEPIWWALPDGRLVALFRDNIGRRLYQSIGTADGRSWTRPERTNFPDATSKIAGQRLSNGLYVLVSNARPQLEERNPLVLSVSRDGLTFTAMGILLDAPTRRRVLGERKTPGYQYPQILERNGTLYVAYSRNKEDIEVVSVPIAAIEGLASEGQRKL